MEYEDKEEECTKLDVANVIFNLVLWLMAIVVISELIRYATK